MHHDELCTCHDAYVMIRGCESVFSTLFGIWSLAVYGSSDFCKFPLSQHRRSEDADVCYHIQLHEDSGIPNTGPYICKANHLPNEFSPQFPHLIVAVLFIIARKWNQLRRLLAEKWIMKMWYMQDRNIFSYKE